jgi:hypothetical protein
MNVQEVMDEIGAKLDTITGLRVFAYAPDDVPVPAAIVGLPEDIQFDQTYGRGSDEMDVPVWVLVAVNADRSSSKELAAYLNGSGSKSVKTKLDSKANNTYTKCDTVRVTRAETGPIPYAGAIYLGAEFTVHITGSGS